MTAAEAEAAIGPRGVVTVTADNRGLVRKWFVAQGLLAAHFCSCACNGEGYQGLLRRQDASN